jgi:DNA polymerase-3 subunit epsilon
MQTHPFTEHQLAVVEWARKLLARPDFVIVDTETTGTGRDDEAVSIAVVDGTGAVLMDTLIHPRKAITPGAMRVHGIQNRDVDKAPRFVEVYPALAEAVNGKPLVAYNLDFDWRILRHGCTSGKLPALKPKSRHCAMKQYAQFAGDWDATRGSYRWKSLAAACARFGIDRNAAHSAAGDCLDTLELIRHIAASAP